MARPDRTGSSTDVPGGSWAQTARNVRFEGGVLYAELQRRDGSWRAVQVDVDNPTFANVDGVFVPSESESAIDAITGGSAPSAATATQIAQIATQGAKIAGMFGGDGGSFGGGDGGGYDPGVDG